MKKILINDNEWQTRIAITQNGKLQNIYFSAHVENPLERSFFKGTVTKVLPGIQTAFVDIGQEKAGFLHISEIDHDLAIDRLEEKTEVDEDRESETRKRREPRQQRNISDILKEGDSVLVQVSKEPVYEKGAKLSTCFTLPGRFIVLMPNIPRIGISKKISDRDERSRLRDIVRAHLPEGMGAIIRTTSEEKAEKEIIKDINFLVKIWETIQTKYNTAKPTEKLHEDIELPLQIVRDHLDDDVEAIISDNKEVRNEIIQFVKEVAPEYSHKIALYTGTDPIFIHFGVEKQIEYALSKKVPLKSGGSLIIESAEAMTVIDVNTGKFTGKKNLEETILKTNIEAAEETVRQLRLRNIGGLIVIDFIDMFSGSNKQKLSRFFEKKLREQDKFQSVVLKVSEFGLVQMTRKRSGKTLVQQLTDTCSCCRGLGFVKSLQTESYEILRALKEMIKDEKPKTDLILSVSPSMFEYISTTEYNSIFKLEKLLEHRIEIESLQHLSNNQYKIEKK